MVHTKKDLLIVYEMFRKIFGQAVGSLVIVCCVTHFNVLNFAEQRFNVAN